MKIIFTGEAALTLATLTTIGSPYSPPAGSALNPFGREMVIIGFTFNARFTDVATPPTVASREILAAPVVTDDAVSMVTEAVLATPAVSATVLGENTTFTPSGNLLAERIAVPLEPGMSERTTVVFARSSRSIAPLSIVAEMVAAPGPGVDGGVVPVGAGDVGEDPLGAGAVVEDDDGAGAFDETIGDSSSSSPRVETGAAPQATKRGNERRRNLARIPN